MSKDSNQRDNDYRCNNSVYILDELREWAGPFVSQKDHHFMMRDIDALGH